MRFLLLVVTAFAACTSSEPHIDDAPAGRGPPPVAIYVVAHAGHTGIAVPRDEAGLPTVRVEIDPCYANSAEELADRLPDGFSIDGDVLLKDEE